jgi:hypothetical protein
MDHPFAVGGSSYFVTNAAVQIPPGAGQSFRIVNLAAVGTPQTIAWGLTNAVTATAPIAGTPQANTLVLLGGTERVVCIPTQGLFFIASAATGFMVTQGDGL